MELKLYNNDVHDIHTILNAHREHPKIQTFLERRNLIVLDLGCGLPDFLYEMYHRYECIENIIGVDRNYIRVNEQTKGTGHSMYDLYKYTLEQNPDWLQGDKKNILSGDEYVSNFTLLYRHYIDNFFTLREYKNLQCDYLILSNILHLMKNDENFFSKAIAKLKSGGLIYARVNHQLNSNSIKGYQIPFTEECYIELFKDFEMIEYSLFEYEKYEEHGKAIALSTATNKEGILYFGSKK